MWLSENPSRQSRATPPDIEFLATRSILPCPCLRQSSGPFPPFEARQRPSAPRPAAVRRTSPGNGPTAVLAGQRSRKRGWASVRRPVLCRRNPCYTVEHDHAHAKIALVPVQPAVAAAVCGLRGRPVLDRRLHRLERGCGYRRWRHYGRNRRQVVARACAGSCVGRNLRGHDGRGLRNHVATSLSSAFSYPDTISA